MKLSANGPTLQDVFLALSMPSYLSLLDEFDFPWLSILLNLRARLTFPCMLAGELQQPIKILHLEIQYY
jgi:hypothetical protein